jgi:hypothetical protein
LNKDNWVDYTKPSLERLEQMNKSKVGWDYDRRFQDTER